MSSVTYSTPNLKSCLWDLSYTRKGRGFPAVLTSTVTGPPSGELVSSLVSQFPFTYVPNKEKEVSRNPGGNSCPRTGYVLNMYMLIVIPQGLPCFLKVSETRDY